MVWEENYAYNVDETVKAHIKSLRKKLTPAGAEYIKNVWGIGDRFSADENKKHRSNFLRLFLNLERPGGYLLSPPDHGRRRGCCRCNGAADRGRTHPWLEDKLGGCQELEEAVLNRLVSRILVEKGGRPEGSESHNYL